MSKVQVFYLLHMCGEKFGSLSHIINMSVLTMKTGFNIVYLDGVTIKEFNRNFIKFGERNRKLVGKESEGFHGYSTAIRSVSDDTRYEEVSFFGEKEKEHWNTDKPCRVFNIFIPFKEDRILRILNVVDEGLSRMSDDITVNIFTTLQIPREMLEIKPMKDNKYFYLKDFFIRKIVPEELKNALLDHFYVSGPGYNEEDFVARFDRINDEHFISMDAVEIMTFIRQTGKSKEDYKKVVRAVLMEEE